MTSRRRTDFAAFVFDLMDFIEDRVRQALADEDVRAKAITEAGGTVPVLRDRLREQEEVMAAFTLTLDDPMNDDAKWWPDLAGKDRAAFEAEARHLLDAWANLRNVVADPTPSEGSDF